MRKVKTFPDYFEIYDDDVLVARLPLITEEYNTVELHLSSLEPPPDIVRKGNVPEEVTLRQAKLALLHNGLLDAVDQIVANMPGVEGKAARIEWESANGVKRNSALVMGIAQILNLTEDQLDDLFLLAETFES